MSTVPKILQSGLSPSDSRKPHSRQPREEIFGTLQGREVQEGSYCVAVSQAIALNLASWIANRPVTVTVSALGFASSQVIKYTSHKVGKGARRFAGRKAVQLVSHTASIISEDVIKQARETRNGMQRILDQIPFVSNITSVEKWVEDEGRKAQATKLQVLYKFILPNIFPIFLKGVEKVAQATENLSEKASSAFRHSYNNPGLVVNKAAEAQSQASKIWLFRAVQEDFVIKNKAKEKIEPVLDTYLTTFASYSFEQQQHIFDQVASSKELSLNSKKREKYYTYLKTLQNALSQSLGGSYHVSKKNSNAIFSLNQLQQAVQQLVYLYGKREDFEKEISRLRKVFQGMFSIEELSEAEKIFFALCQDTCSKDIVAAKQKEFITLIKKKIEEEEAKIQASIETAIAALDNEPKNGLKTFLSIHEAHKHQFEHAFLTRKAFQSLGFYERMRLIEIVSQYAPLSHSERALLEKVRRTKNEDEWLAALTSIDNNEYIATDNDAEEAIQRVAAVGFNTLLEEQKEQLHYLTLQQLDLTQLTQRKELVSIVQASLVEKIQEESVLLETMQQERSTFSFSPSPAYEKKEKYIEQLGHAYNTLKNLQSTFNENNPAFLTSLEEQQSFLHIVNAMLSHDERHAIQQLLQTSFSLVVFKNKDEIEVEIKKIQKLIEECKDENSMTQLKAYHGALEKASITQHNFKLHIEEHASFSTLIVSQDGIFLPIKPISTLSTDKIQRAIGHTIVSQGYIYRASTLIGSLSEKGLRRIGKVPRAIFQTLAKSHNPRAIQLLTRNAARIMQILGGCVFFVSPVATRMSRMGVNVRFVENAAIEMTKSSVMFLDIVLQAAATQGKKFFEFIEKNIESQKIKEFQKEYKKAYSDGTKMASDFGENVSQFCRAQSGVDEVCKEFKDIAQDPDAVLKKVQDSIKEGKKDVIDIIKAMLPQAEKPAFYTWSYWKDYVVQNPQLQQIEKIVQDPEIQKKMQELAGRADQLLYINDILEKSKQTIGATQECSSIIDSIISKMPGVNIDSSVLQGMQNAVKDIQHGIDYMQGFMAKTQIAQEACLRSLDLAYIPGIVTDAAQTAGERSEAKIDRAMQGIEPTSHKAYMLSIFKGLVSYGIPLASSLTVGGGHVVLSFFLRSILPQLIERGGDVIAEHGGSFWGYLAKASEKTADAAAAKSQEHMQSLGKQIQGWANRGRYIDPQRIENFKKMSLEEQTHVVTLILNSKDIRQKNNEEEVEKYKKLQQAWDIYKKKSQSFVYVDKFIEQILKEFDLLDLKELLIVTPSSFHGFPKNIQSRLRQIVINNYKLTQAESDDVETIVVYFNKLKDDQKNRLSYFTPEEFHTLSADDQMTLKLRIVQSHEFQKLLESENTAAANDRQYTTAGRFSSETILQELNEEKNWTENRLRILLPLYNEIPEGEVQSRLTVTQLRAKPLSQLYNIVQLISKYGIHNNENRKIYKRLVILENILKQEMNGYQINSVDFHKKNDYLKIVAIAFSQLTESQQQELGDISESEMLYMSDEEIGQLADFLLSVAPQQELKLIADLRVQASSNTKGALKSIKALVEIYNKCSYADKARYRALQEAQQLETTRLTDAMLSEVRKIDEDLKKKIGEEKKKKESVVERQKGIEELQKRQKTLHDEQLENQKAIAPAHLDTFYKEEFSKIDNQIRLIQLQLDDDLKEVEACERIINALIQSRKYFEKVLKDSGIAIPAFSYKEYGNVLSAEKNRVINKNLDFIFSEVLFQSYDAMLQSKKDPKELTVVLQQIQDMCRTIIETSNRKGEELEKEIASFEEKNKLLRTKLEGGGLDLDRREIISCHDEIKKNSFEIEYIQDNKIAIHKKVVEKVNIMQEKLEHSAAACKEKLQDISRLQKKIEECDAMLNECNTQFYSVDRKIIECCIVRDVLQDRKYIALIDISITQKEKAADKTRDGIQKLQGERKTTYEELQKKGVEATFPLISELPQRTNFQTHISEKFQADSAIISTIREKTEVSEIQALLKTQIDAYMAPIDQAKSKIQELLQEVSTSTASLTESDKFSTILERATTIVEFQVKQQIVTKAANERIIELQRAQSGIGKSRIRRLFSRFSRNIQQALVIAKKKSTSFFGRARSTLFRLFAVSQRKDKQEKK